MLRRVRPRRGSVGDHTSVFAHHASGITVLALHGPCKFIVISLQCYFDLTEHQELHVAVATRKSSERRLLHLSDELLAAVLGAADAPGVMYRLLQVF